MKTKEDLAREYAYGRDLMPTLEGELLTPKFTEPTKTSLLEHRAFLNGYSAAESRIEELERRLKATEQALMDRDMEVAKLKSEYANLEEKLKIAVKALEFYAEKSNWVTRTGKIGVCPIDTVDREFNKEDYPFAGGKLARETLAKIKGEG